jgi:hypothetical protein
MLAIPPILLQCGGLEGIMNSHLSKQLSYHCFGEHGSMELPVWGSLIYCGEPARHRVAG